MSNVSNTIPSLTRADTGLVTRIANVRDADSAPPVTPDREILADYLCLYEPALECCQDACLGLFTLPDKQSLFTRNISEIIDRSIRCAKTGAPAALLAYSPPYTAGKAEGSVKTQNDDARRDRPCQ